MQDPGSAWTNTTALYIGGSSTTPGGDGQLNINTNAAVTANGVTRIWPEGKLDVNAATFNTGSLLIDGQADATNATVNITGSSLNITPTGQLNVTGDAGPFNSPNAVNSGQLNATDTTLTFPANATHDDVGLVNLGTLNLDNTTIDGDLRSPAGSVINITNVAGFNALVSGAAQFTGTGAPFFNNAYQPGDSTAQINFPNGYFLSPDTTVTIEAATPTPPDAAPTPGLDFDQLNAATAAVVFDGTLDVDLIDTAPDDRPQLGTEYPILTYNARAFFGPTMFDNITGTLIATDFALAPLFTDTDTIPVGNDDTLILRASIPGDLNLDNKVSVADLSTFALNFNTTPGLYVEATDTNSWELGDFNADGAVTVADLSLLALNFGFDATDPANPTPATGVSLHTAAILAGLDPATLPEPPTITLATLLIAASSQITRRQPS